MSAHCVVVVLGFFRQASVLAPSSRLRFRTGRILPLHLLQGRTKDYIVRSVLLLKLLSPPRGQFVAFRAGGRKERSERGRSARRLVKHRVLFCFRGATYPGDCLKQGSGATPEKTPVPRTRFAGSLVLKQPRSSSTSSRRVNLTE